MPANWRLLEDEIVQIARKWDGEVTEANDGDKIVVFACNDDPNAYSVNLTAMAIELSERVEVKGGKS